MSEQTRFNVSLVVTILLAVLLAFSSAPVCGITHPAIAIAATAIIGSRLCVYVFWGTYLGLPKKQ